MDADFRERLGGRHVGHVEGCPRVRENVFGAVCKVGIFVAIDTCAIDRRVFANGEKAPLEQHAAVDGPWFGRPVDPDCRAVVVADTLAGGESEGNGDGGGGEHAVVDLIIDGFDVRRAVERLDGVHEMMFLRDPQRIVRLRRIDETRVAVGDFLRAVFIDSVGRSRVEAPDDGIRLRLPAGVVAHAVVRHLMVDFQQVEIQKRRLVFAVRLGFDAVAWARPEIMEVAFAEEGAAMRLAHVIVEILLRFDLQTGHAGQRLRGVVIDTPTGRTAGLRIDVSHCRLVTLMDFGGVLLGVFQGVVAFDDIALDSRAWIVPCGKLFAVCKQGDGRFVV